VLLSVCVSDSLSYSLILLLFSLSLYFVADEVGKAKEQQLTGVGFFFRIPI
jgi:hypothetical protein